MAAIHAAAFPPGEAWDAAAIAAQLALPTTFGLIAPAGGMLLARAIAEQAEILTLAVIPAARRRGIARALLQAAGHEAGRRGARTMFLEVSGANSAARGLYGAAGFVEIGRRARYYWDGTDALILSAPLSPAPCESATG
ncbi:MAG: GNAT family N-acetyltransferase [Alphaproteobacteria bacterium]|nr:GNAT family N-acetyltransferase [Alphaproteobacteria bacterium]